MPPAHSQIFGIMRGKVGYQLPPISIVLEARLVPWFQLGKSYQTIATDIEILLTAQMMTVTEPVVTGDAKNRPNFSVQNPMMISKA